MIDASSYETVDLGLFDEINKIKNIEINKINNNCINNLSIEPLFEELLDKSFSCLTNY